MIEFNMNWKVGVRLTDAGRRALDRPPPEDADGWSEWQLHDLMGRFGDQMYPRMDPPFEPTIRLVPEASPTGSCAVDLTRTDTYPGGVVPDADFETCLKVLRTVRNLALGPKAFRAETVLILSEAHKTLHDLCVEVQENERAERAEAKPE